VIDAIQEKLEDSKGTIEVIQKVVEASWEERKACQETLEAIKKR
jgi:precorrin-4 methylase